MDVKFYHSNRPHRNNLERECIIAEDIIGIVSRRRCRLLLRHNNFCQYPLSWVQFVPNYVLRIDFKAPVITTKDPEGIDIREKDENATLWAITFGKECVGAGNAARRIIPQKIPGRYLCSFC